MTYSIVACDDEHLGVATASHWIAVGSLVAWAEAGVGAVATQAFTNPAYGPRALGSLAAGAAASTAVENIIADDPLRDLRQVALIDAAGRTAHHTGPGCFPVTATNSDSNAVATGNMLASTQVPAEIQKTFTASIGSLAERLVAALAAGEEAGGDARGRQAAALLVVQKAPQPDTGLGIVVDLRVDDHPHPVAELGRLLNLHAEYAQISNAVFPSHTDVLTGASTHDLAETEAQLSGFVESFAGETRVEATLWLALSHLRNGRREEAMRVLRQLPEMIPVVSSWNQHLSRRQVED
ncbi:hypothetical protein BH23ACT11_BH23ACT11_22890 [soil metagenome]